MVTASPQRRPKSVPDRFDLLDWVTENYQESEVAAKQAESRILEDTYSCLPSRAWYYDYLTYREHLEPSSTKYQTSIDGASDTYTAGSNISYQQDDDALEISDDGPECVFDPKEMAYTLYGIGGICPELASEDFAVDNPWQSTTIRYGSRSHSGAKRSYQSCQKPNRAVYSRHRLA